MKRPIAYVSAPWTEDEDENHLTATASCGLLYIAGYAPICPMMMDAFIDYEILADPDEALEMGREYMRRADVLVLCGPEVTPEMEADILAAREAGLIITTLNGIMDARHVR